MENAKVNNRIPLRRVTQRFWKPINSNIPRIVSAMVAVHANNGIRNLGIHGNKTPV